MSPRKFDRYMVGLGAGRHVKFRRLTIPERYAFFMGVLSLAAQSPERGCLMIGSLRVEAGDVAAEADVPEKVAASAMEKLRAVGVIEDDGHFEWVHDFEEWNPGPKSDATNAERQRRYQAKLKAAHDAVSNGVSDETPAPVLTATNAPPCVEGELEGEREREKTSPAASGGVAESRSAIARRVFAHWQAACNHPTARFTNDRRSKVEARLREGYTEQQLLAAVDGAARAPFTNEQGKTFDDLELICRTGSKVEGFMQRTAPRTLLAAAVPGEFAKYDLAVARNNPEAA